MMSAPFLDFQSHYSRQNRKSKPYACCIVLLAQILFVDLYKDLNKSKIVENNDLRGQIVKALIANGINRNFSILGGEPLCKENAEDVLTVLTCVKIALPNTKVFLWTGYTYEYLISLNDDCINGILSKVDILIDGSYINSERDLTLYLRGSRNQRVIDLKSMREKKSKSLILIDKQ
jgi:anaerobic ribonucleoside-triphosphate reductase activating protein